MAVQRGPFMDQSQSMNLYMSNPTFSKLSSAIMYGWKKGLKTLCYYVRTKAISTGAKHLATDVSKIGTSMVGQEPEARVNVTPPTVLMEAETPMWTADVVESGSSDSDFECIGCGS